MNKTSSEVFYSSRRDKILNSKEHIRISQYNAYLKNIDNPQGKNWRKWGCYLSERQWGTVRESYDCVDNSWGEDGNNASFSREQALNRAYRWGEDGIAGLSDDHQFICFSLSLWNEADPCIKERLYGLTNREGIHGEDVKEYYFYADNTPMHSYMKYIYKYPYYYNYDEIYNNRNSKVPYEFELSHTGAFDGNRYFDVTAEYAKNDTEDILIKLTVKNCGNERKTLHLLPTVLFRNTWSFNKDLYEKTMTKAQGIKNAVEIIQRRKQLPADASIMRLYCQDAYENILFTENNTDYEAAFKSSNAGRQYFKNGINNYIIGKYREHLSEEELWQFINPREKGTKASVHYRLALNPGQSGTVVLRLSDVETDLPFEGFDSAFTRRKYEADEFYDAISPYDRNGSAEEQDLYNIQRQAFAGMLWNKQLYNLIVEQWLEGDEMQPRPSDRHMKDEKMLKWKHMYSNDILSMPDKWEYPWFAAWDMAFHTVTLGIIDPEFAKHQLLLLCMEWFMHPNGQIPAYEWDFCNVNPPVHAWAAWNVYQQERLIYGTEDRDFLERILDKLNMNFTWWINNVDSSKGNDNVFGGGFLGLDNIRIVSKDPKGRDIVEADGTSWMARFCLDMINIAGELGKHDIQRKYLQHFIYICDAMNKIGEHGFWNEKEEFFCDYANEFGSLGICSAVGLVPLFAIERIRQRLDSKQRYAGSFMSIEDTLNWYKRKRPDLIDKNENININGISREDRNGITAFECYMAVVDKEKLSKILKKLLDKNKFLSDFGIRSLSKDCNFNWYGKNIFYEPAESNREKIMGGNSNWRGPIWFPINYMLIEALRKYGDYLGGSIEIRDSENGEGISLNLYEIADDIAERLISVFKKNQEGRRPVYGMQELFERSGWENLILFFEYFHGDNGAGLGASHQTGWTGLAANLIQQLGIDRKKL
ncbi:glycosyl hydrolase family 63 [Ruminiclostridium sufflavum DSM 19573]|uniref:Glycosyl hydrolase family 63 n=1 Tax=Ruminiclostridium sufflavum DSM 19573 TaxID=1121337 RepID=A0A318XYD0_9FIRM|nr:glucosidase [Ruminiclostridium sufflavum]PYG87833.1 glycosyl hydrolase family 63 [Ruminiclostridium sufflavum DSM 19573]